MFQAQFSSCSITSCALNRSETQRLFSIVPGIPLRHFPAITIIALGFACPCAANPMPRLAARTATPHPQLVGQNPLDPTWNP